MLMWIQPWTRYEDLRRGQKKRDDDRWLRMLENASPRLDSKNNTEVPVKRLGVCVNEVAEEKDSEEMRGGLARASDD